MSSAVTLALTPLGRLYGVAMRARRALYGSGRLRTHKLGLPVISVGNLTTGGTGKTPLVEWIGRELARTGKRVCILTRGYGRDKPGARVVVSDGRQILSDAAEAGDEPLLLAESLKGLAAVISDADRVAAAGWAVDNLHSEVFVLDDGFQHLRLARNLNILTIDAANPWGNRKLLPAGILRESPTELARADCVVITRTDEATAVAELRSEIVALNHEIPIFSSRMRVSGIRDVHSQLVQSSIVQKEIRGSTISAFCGIGNPESFFSLLRRAGYQPAYTQAFRDHHTYTQSDLDRVVRKSVARSAQILLTTAKDEVKLRSLTSRLPCYAVEIEIEIENEERLKALIAAATAPR
jgi:tetraacyldisaccharide 4'-kinase